MKEKMVEVVRYTCVIENKTDFYNVITIPVKRITKTSKVSLKRIDKEDLSASKKSYDQGIHLSDVLSFTFREAQGSSNIKKIYEMYCFKDQEFIGYKLFNKRLTKAIKKEEKRNESKERSN